MNKQRVSTTKGSPRGTTKESPWGTAGALRLSWARRLPEWRYALPLPDRARCRLATGWLAVGVAAVALSGLFSLLLVAARTPYVNRLLPMADFFHAALVVHVDLSVLVWFLAFGGMLWSLNCVSRGLAWGWAALVMAAAGALVMAAAPFVAGEPPVMSNYVPVLDGPMFLAGLVAVGVGTLVAVARALAAVPAVGVALDEAGALRFGLNAAAVAAAVAALAFAGSWWDVPATLSGKAYYELLFWGGGHVLQFTYTLLMLVAWLWLAGAGGVGLSLSPRTAVLLLALGLAMAFAVPVIYLAYPVTAPEHHRLLVWVMQFGGGLAIPPFVLAVAVGLWRAAPACPEQRPLRASLVSSLILFGVGGFIGFLISGSDVRIPAHYHGCIVGVTLAFMGLTYHLLDWLSLGRVPVRLATIQPYVYGAGQLLHILGLLWSGGYGVQRKVAGSAQVLDNVQQVLGMGLMGLGGLVAIMGGMLFLLAVVWAVARRETGRGG